MQCLIQVLRKVWSPLNFSLTPYNPSHPNFSRPYQIISKTAQLDGKTPADIEKMIRKSCHEVKLSRDICVLPYGITIDKNFELKYPGKRYCRIFFIQLYFYLSHMHAFWISHLMCFKILFNWVGLSNIYLKYTNAMFLIQGKKNR